MLEFLLDVLKGFKFQIKLSFSFQSNLEAYFLKQHVYFPEKVILITMEHLRVQTLLSSHEGFHFLILCFESFVKNWSLIFRYLTLKSLTTAAESQEPC